MTALKCQASALSGKPLFRVNFISATQFPPREMQPEYHVYLAEAKLFSSKLPVRDCPRISVRFSAVTRGNGLAQKSTGLTPFKHFAAYWTVQRRLFYLQSLIVEMRRDFHHNGSIQSSAI